LTLAETGGGRYNLGMPNAMNAPIDFVRESAELLKLIRERSYREGDFTLASGKKSTFYIDVKTATLHGQGAYLIGRLGYELVARYARMKLGSTGAIGGVGGLTLGADPIATAVSLSAYVQGVDWPAYIVRKEAKGHGTLKYVEGRENLRPGAKLIVLEDVVTTGGSSLQAIERLRGEGFDPVAVLTVVDREEGGEALLQSKGLDFLRILGLSEIRARS
jgi:orotate phosphoribosyltransferase